MRVQVTSLAALGALVLGCALPFLSGGLDDFDSFSFALALDRYDLYLQQPHPPGFPLYIMLAQGVRALVGDGQRALVLLSALGGALGVMATAHIGARLFDRKTGALAGVLLAATPAYWLTSLVALSDTLGLALVLAAIALLLEARRYPAQSRRAGAWFAAGALVAGLSLGVRPHNALPLLWVAIWLWSWVRKDAPHLLGLGLVAGVVACLLWALPMLAAVGGLATYLDAVRSHSQHVVTNDSLLANNLSLTTRITAFASGTRGMFGGEDATLLAAAVVSALAGVGVLRAGKRGAVAFLLLWLVSVTLKLFLLESLERTRLYLPLLPPLWLLVAWGAPRVLRMPFARVALRAGLLLLACAFFVQTLPFAALLARVPSAPEQAAAYVRQHYAPEDTLVIMFGSHRATQYMLGDYPQMYLFFYEREFWTRDIAYRQVPYIAMFDRDNVWEEAYQTIVSTRDYVPIEDITFKRDARAFPQHSEVRLQMLAPLAAVMPHQLALAEDSSIVPSVERDGKHFGAGWFRVEDIGGVAARWAGKEARLQVTLPVQAWRMRFNALPYGQGQRVRVVVNARDVGEVTLRDGWQTYELLLPAEALHEGVTLIELRHAHADQPRNAPRFLAAAYANFGFAPP